MGKNVKKQKFKRKVTLLRYKDRRDGLIFSRTVETTREKLTIKVNFKPEVKNWFNKKEFKRKHPLLRYLVRERTVPCCSRAKCIGKSTKTHERDRDRRILPIRKDYVRNKQKSAAQPPIEINDDDCISNVFEHEDISSGSMSSCYTDDEMDALLTSTRKRMRDLDKEWTIIPTQLTSNSNDLSKTKDMNQSTYSLDTLVLEDDDEDYPISDIKSETYSPTISPEIFYNEPIKINNNIIKLKSHNKIKLDNTNLKQCYIKKDIDKKFIDPDVIKLEKDIKCLSKINNFGILNNNIKLETMLKSCQTMYVNNNKEYSHKKYIDAVVTKLEKDDMDYHASSNTFSIKQEAYND